MWWLGGGAGGEFCSSFPPCSFASVLRGERRDQRELGEGRVWDSALLVCVLEVERGKEGGVPTARN